MSKFIRYIVKSIVILKFALSDERVFLLEQFFIEVYVVELIPMHINEHNRYLPYPRLNSLNPQVPGCIFPQNDKDNVLYIEKTPIKKFTIFKSVMLPMKRSGLKHF